MRCQWLSEEKMRGRFKERERKAAVSRNAGRKNN